MAARPAAHCSQRMALWLREDQGPVRGRAPHHYVAKVGRVVCATDAGREGELIFRYIYEAAACTSPSAACGSPRSPGRIRRGFEGLRDGREYDPLADAARGAAAPTGWWA